MREKNFESNLLLVVVLVSESKALYYRDDLPKNPGKTTAQEWKMSISGGRASLKNVFA